MQITGATALSIFSLLIALSSAGFTGLTWHDTRQHFLLSTRPHIDFQTEYDPDEPPVGVAITNSGPGPAIIKSVTFYVDRKSVRDADEAGRDYAN